MFGDRLHEILKNESIKSAIQFIKFKEYNHWSGTHDELLKIFEEMLSDILKNLEDEVKKIHREVGKYLEFLELNTDEESKLSVLPELLDYTEKKISKTKIDVKISNRAKRFESSYLFRENLETYRLIFAAVLLDH